MIERVFNEIEFKRIALQEVETGEAEERDVQMEDERKNIRPTERFLFLIEVKLISVYITGLIYFYL